MFVCFILVLGHTWPGSGLTPGFGWKDFCRISGRFKGCWESSPGCLCARQVPCPLYYFSNSFRNLFNQVIKMHVSLRVTDIIISMSNYIKRLFLNLFKTQNISIFCKRAIFNIHTHKKIKGVFHQLKRSRRNKKCLKFDNKHKYIHI